MSENFDKVYKFEWKGGQLDILALANGRDMSHALEIAANAVARYPDGEPGQSNNPLIYMYPDKAERMAGLSGSISIAQCMLVHVSSNW
jgi:hypothetical protein